MPAQGAAPVVRFGSGAMPTDINTAVSQFRSDLGGTNNGVGGSFLDGYREITWDTVPSNSAAPNNLQADFYNTSQPVGAVFSTPGTGFQVSAMAGGGVPVRFGNIDGTYSGIFQTFSSEQLFTSLDSTISDVSFFIPGLSQFALVSGFGAVFSDVDSATSTTLQFFDVDNNELFSAFAPVSPPGGLSFLGVSFGEAQVARVRITSGDTALGPGITDGGSRDLVVMDNFILGEPAAVPEPSTWALVGLGGFLVFLRRHRRH
jgi:hypothetical protein